MDSVTIANRLQFDSRVRTDVYALFALYWALVLWYILRCNFKCILTIFSGQAKLITFKYGELSQF